MTAGRRATAACLLGGAILPLPGCRAPQPIPLLDLALYAPVADLEAGFQTVLFGTPAAEGLQENGFRREGRQDEGDVWAGVAPSARLLLRWPQPQARVAVLDLEPQAGGAGRAVEVALNGTPVARLTLANGRRRYEVELPAGVQKPGVNRLRIALGDAPPSEGTAGKPSLARAYGLTVGLSADPAMRALAADGAPPVLSLQGPRDDRDLLQAGPSTLSYAMVLPESAEIRLGARVHAFSGPRRVRLRITLQEEGGPPRDLWAQHLATGAEAAAVRLHLPGRPGSAVRLGLHVETPEGTDAAWAVWQSPRVWGTGGSTLLLAAAPVDLPPEASSVSAMRRAMARTHVLLIVLDAAAAGHFGCYGYARATTPEIDRIAREGVVFERAYTPAVFTYAAIAALWTSQVPDQGHSEWIRNGDGMLPSDRPTLAGILDANGVHTAAFVANPSASTGFGLDRGFKEFHALYRPPWSTDGVPRAEAFGQALHPWLQRPPPGRFFVYAHFREPHSPYEPPAPFDTQFTAPQDAAVHGTEWLDDITRGRRPPTGAEVDHLVRLYDANLAYADREIGRLRSVLERAGLWERTLVIVTADHGEAMYEHGWVGHNTQVYEESAHIPLVMRFPAGTGPSGVRVKELTGLLDLAPTIAEAFGLKRVPSFRGRSLLPAVAGSRTAGSVVSRTSGWTYGLVHGRYKLVHDLSSASQELYDLEADPRERTDLASRQPLRAAAYRQSLHRWLLDLRGPGPAIWSPVQLDAYQRETLRALGYLH